MIHESLHRNFMWTEIGWLRRSQGLILLLQYAQDFQTMASEIDTQNEIEMGFVNHRRDSFMSTVVDGLYNRV